METTTKLHAQIASEAGVPHDQAKAAAYLLDLSRAGKTLDDAAALMRCTRGEVRDISRDWSIPFPDYVPSDPVPLEWSRDADGWALRGRGEVLARIYRRAATQAVPAGHDARWERANAALTETGSTPLTAARKLSAEISKRSRELLGVDDIEISFVDAGGGGDAFTPCRSTESGFAPPCRRSRPDCLKSLSLERTPV